MASRSCWVRVSSADLVAEVKERRFDGDEVDEFYEEVGTAAVEAFSEDNAVIDLGELELLNDWFWREPEKAPGIVRTWLQQITGRV